MLFQDPKPASAKVCPTSERLLEAGITGIRRTLNRRKRCVGRSRCRSDMTAKGQRGQVVSQGSSHDKMSTKLKRLTMSERTSSPCPWVSITDLYAPVC
jgi:hypothetical protein